MKYVLKVHSGGSFEYYFINDKFEIIQADRYRQYGDAGFSQQWRLICFYEETKFGHTRRLDIENFNTVPTHYKNGKSRILVCDNDHGTPRVWGTQRVASFHPVQNFS